MAFNWDKEVQRYQAEKEAQANEERSKIEAEERRLSQEQGQCRELGLKLQIPQLLTSYRDQIWEFGEVTITEGAANLHRETGFLTKSDREKFFLTQTREPEIPRTKGEKIYAAQCAWIQKLERYGKEDFGYVKFALTCQIPVYRPEIKTSYDRVFDGEQIVPGKPATVHFISLKPPDKAPAIYIGRLKHLNYAIRAVVPDVRASAGKVDYHSNRLHGSRLETLYPGDPDILEKLKLTFAKQIDLRNKRSEPSYADIVRQNIREIKKHRREIMRQDPQSYRQFEKFLREHRL